MLFSLHGRRKRGKKQVERNSQEPPLLAFSLPYRHLPRRLVWDISLQKSRCLFFRFLSDERIQARSKRGLLPIARFGPTRLLRVLVARKTRKNGVFSEGNLIFGQTLPTCSIERTLRSSLSRKITEEGRRVFCCCCCCFFSHGVQYLNGNKQTESTVPVQCSILSRGISF